MLEPPEPTDHDGLHLRPATTEYRSEVLALTEPPSRLRLHHAARKRGERPHRSAPGIFRMKGRRRSSPRPSPSSSARLRSFTCAETSATSSQGIRTTLPPPIQAVKRPTSPARRGQAPGPLKIATTSSL